MLCLLAAGAVRAQVSQARPAADSPTGTVTGTVIAQDTERPARLAQVELVALPQTGAGGPMSGGMVTARTDLDGVFTASHVPVGDYYVLATAAGYVPTGALLRAQVAAGADPIALLGALPQVHVAAENTSNVTVTMQRGGVIAGHVEWEDGSPVSGVSVNAASTAATPALPQAVMGVLSAGGGRPLALTDDRGNFRIVDLASGDYLVQVLVDIGGRFGASPGYYLQQAPSRVRVFAPGVFRSGDGKAVSVRAGDERTDARVVIDLRGLHTVSGHASSLSPGETVAAGAAYLTDTTDNTLQIQSQIEADGSFKLRFVPPGTYTLRITGGNSVAPSFGNFRGGRSGDRDNAGRQPRGVAFQDFATTITVSDTDVTGVAVSLVPVQSQSR
jgi:hypothetical protein